ncbi:MAG: hypothetical protein ACTSQB_05625 [Candidatus Heimdallarchaeota archaeon]
MVQCVVCKATIEKGEYCDSHMIAKKNLVERYDDWIKAFGKLAWNDYLTMMVNDQDIPIGDWAREVADYLLKNKKR